MHTWEKGRASVKADTSCCPLEASLWMREQPGGSRGKEKQVAEEVAGEPDPSVTLTSLTS